VFASNPVLVGRGFTHQIYDIGPSFFIGIWSPSPATYGAADTKNILSTLALEFICET